RLLSGHVDGLSSVARGTPSPDAAPLVVRGGASARRRRRVLSVPLVVRESLRFLAGGGGTGAPDGRPWPSSDRRRLAPARRLPRAVSSDSPRACRRDVSVRRELRRAL